MQARAFAASGQRQGHGRCVQQPQRTHRVLSVKVSANMCPYNTLGVQPSASDTEVKQAYRKLVLQYHPDVNHGQGAAGKFMTIQQAYELLTGKSRNSREGADGRRTDWAFHDWYWSFMQKRRWGSYKRGSAAAAAAAAAADTTTSGFDSTAVPPHKQPEHQSTLRSQLAGLRHRAAIRAKKQQNKAAAAASAANSATSTMEEEKQQGTPLEYDSSEMSDGCNMASGVTDWQAAEAAHAAASAKRRFSATESHRQQVMERLAGLHRMAAEKGAGGMW